MYLFIHLDIAPEPDQRRTGGAGHSVALGYALFVSTHPRWKLIPGLWN